MHVHLAVVAACCTVGRVDHSNRRRADVLHHHVGRCHTLSLCEKTPIVLDVVQPRIELPLLCEL